MLTRLYTPPATEEFLRTPDHPEKIILAERATNAWSDEFFRRYVTTDDKVKPYTLPPLPATLDEWKRKRPEILQQFKDCMYGFMPPAPDKLRVETMTIKDDALDGKAIRKECRIYCEMNDGRSFNFDMLLYVPKSAVKPPVFIQLNFSGNQANTPEYDVRMTRGPVDDKSQRLWHTIGAPNESWRCVPKQEFMNYLGAMERGYAVATAHCGEIFPDNLDGARKSIFTLFCDEKDLRPDYDIPLEELHQRRRNLGAIGGWAWGYSRILDALEREPLVDASRCAIVGHSRLGKACLWAGANDERFKMVVSNNSGHGGAALSRRLFGETLSCLWHVRPNWFTDKMMEFAGQEELLPIDQHALLALVAPRALYVGSSSLDYTADPKSEFLSAYNASKIWELYGLPGLGVDEMPPCDVSCGKGKIGYHVKTGKHSLTAVDWNFYYDFADRNI